MLSILYGLAVLIVWLAVAESSFSFDKGETLALYPEVTSFGLWRWIAELMACIGLRGVAFYRVVALMFALVYVAVTRWLMRRSAWLASGYGAYFLCWFGFGQLRFGTALSLLMLAIALRATRTRLAICLAVCAALTHVAVAAGLVCLFAWNRLVQRSPMGAVALIALALLLVVLLGPVAVTGAILALTGYSNYMNWLQFDAPNTPYKYGYIIAVLMASWAVERRPHWREVLLAVTLLPTALSPPLAGRAYGFFLAALLPSLAAKTRNEVSPWVSALVCAPLIAEAVLLARSGMWSAM